MTATASAPAPVASDKKVSCPDVFFRVKREGPVAVVHVRTSDRWRALAASRRATSVSLLGSGGRKYSAAIPGDAAREQANPAVPLGVYVVAEIMADGTHRPLTEDETVELTVAAPMPRTEISSHVTNIRDRVTSIVDQYLRPLELSVTVRAAMGSAAEAS